METGLWAFGAAVVSFVITAVIGKYLIPFLRKLKYGQTILEEGPNWHKSKQGTPTMGGIMFIIGIVIATTAGVLLYAVGHGGLDSVSRFVFIGLLYALLNGAIGFEEIKLWNNITTRCVCCLAIELYVICILLRNIELDRKPFCTVRADKRRFFINADIESACCTVY